MKKRVLLRIAAAIAVFCCLLSFAGCRKAMFNVTTNDDGSVSVTAQKAPVESVGIGYVTVEEGQQLVVIPNLSDKSVLQVEVFPYAEPEDPSAVKEALGLLTNEDGAVVSEVISGTEKYSYDVEPGEYYVRVTVIKKSDGTVTITAE